jgi:hypothetical protein
MSGQDDIPDDLVTPIAPPAIGAPVVDPAAITGLPPPVADEAVLDVPIPLVTEAAIPLAGNASPPSPPSAGQASVLPVLGSLAPFRTVPALNVVVTSPVALAVALAPASPIARSSALEDFERGRLAGIASAMLAQAQLQSAMATQRIPSLPLGISPSSRTVRIAPHVAHVGSALGAVRPLEHSSMFRASRNHANLMDTQFSPDDPTGMDGGPGDSTSGLSDPCRTWSARETDSTKM